MNISHLYHRDFDISHPDPAVLIIVKKFIDGQPVEKEPDELVWVRDADGNVCFKALPRAVADYVTSIAPVSLPRAYFALENSRLILVVDGRKYNCVNNLRGSLEAVVFSFGLGKWLVSRMLNPLSPSSNHPEAEILTQESSSPPSSNGGNGHKPASGSVQASKKNSHKKSADIGDSVVPETAGPNKDNGDKGRTELTLDELFEKVSPVQHGDPEG